MYVSEIARAKGQGAVLILWDSKQYFVRLTVPEQITTIEETAFNPHIGALAMICHRATHVDV